VAEQIPVPPEAEAIKSYPLPNAADAAWEELLALRAQAAELGIEVDEAWPIVRLREEIAKAGGDRG
jgi:hypothetical protein